MQRCGATSAVVSALRMKQLPATLFQHAQPDTGAGVLPLKILGFPNLWTQLPVRPRPLIVGKNFSTIGP